MPAIRVDRVGTEVPRAKPLPRSGLFRAVHAPESAAANSVTQVSESARAQSRSVRRSAAAAQLARLLNNALDADIIPQAALAAAIDRHASEVSDMCRRAEEPRAKDMTGADVLLSAVASQSFYEGFRETVEIMRRSKGK